MKARLVLLLSILIIWSGTAQELEIYGGGNLTRFYDRVGDYYHNLNKYTPGPGAQLGLGFEHVKMGPIPIGMTFSLEKYSGKFYVNNVGLGGGSETEAKVEATSIHLALYPFNIKLLKRHLEISLGWEASLLLQEKVQGVHKWRVLGIGSYEKEISDQMYSYSKKLNSGPIGRICYSFAFGKSWELVPQYKFYLGLTRRFQNLETDVWYSQHLFELAIRKNLSSR